MTIRLEVGITGNDFYLPVLEEILSHQGIIYKLVNNYNNLKFPCIISANSHTDIHKSVKKHCLDTDNIINILDIVHLDKIYFSLSGTLDELYLTNRLTIPIVNEFEKKLLIEIKKCYNRLNLPLVRKWFWPGFKEACYIMTHDVDLLVHRKFFPPPKKLNINYIKYRWINRTKPSSLYWSNIPEMLEEEKKRCVKSTFYFLPEYNSDEQTRLCELTRISKDKLIEKVKKNNCEIGLHGSMWSFQSGKKLEQEKKSIENFAHVKVSGIRQHFLNFIIPHTWRYQEKAGFKYDISFSYNDAFGFRSGICFPYHPIDILERKKLMILEIPTPFMDATSVFTGLKGDELLKIVSNLRKTVESFNGVMVFNFHSGIYNKNVYPDYERAYIDSLGYMSRNNNIWIATAEECATWWRRRENAIISIGLSDANIKLESSENLPIIIERENRAKKSNIRTGISNLDYE